jgi:hypothetical protein
MDVTTIRSTVRTIADTDASDLPDTLIDFYAQEGYDKTVSRDGDWRFFETEYELTSVIGTGGYLLTALSPNTCDDIRSITPTSTTWPQLHYLDHSQAKGIWSGTNDITQIPLYFSMFASQVFLWPRPSTVEVYKVLGWRKPTGIPSNAALEPDLPVEFHRALVYYVVSCFYAKQEDPTLTGLYEAKYESSIQIAMADANRAPQATPLVYGRGGARWNEKRWMESQARRIGS